MTPLMTNRSPPATAGPPFLPVPLPTAPAKEKRGDADAGDGATAKVRRRVLPALLAVLASR
jgi:hypothetical protein